MFKNYVRDPTALSPLNMTISRVLLVTYLLWVLFSNSWNRIHRYPLIADRPNAYALQPLIPEVVLAYVHYLVWVTAIVLVLVAAGVYLRYTAFVASALICYFGLIRFQVSGTWSTHMFFAASLLLLFFALYDEEDRCSIDGLRAVRRSETESVTRHLQTPLTPRYRATPLTLFLVCLGFLYFGSGLAKMTVGGPGWISATNLGRHMYRPVEPGYAPEIRDLVLQFDVLLFVMAAMTIVVEIGFLVSIVIDRFFPMFIVLLIGFHVGIALLMGPVFLYTVVFLALFVNWERIIARVQPETSIDVVYDLDSVHESILYFVKYIDVSETVWFYPQENAPMKLTDRNVVDEATIVLVRGDVTYIGYEAYVQLLRHIRVLTLLSFLLRVPPVATIGRRIVQ